MEIVTFDYAALPPDVVTEAQGAAERIRTRIRAAIVDVGADLIGVKDRLPHGAFSVWLKAEFGMTERTAQNYMSAAALAGKYETVSVLPPKNTVPAGCSLNPRAGPARDC
jgi:hypothetical protein